VFLIVGLGNPGSKYRKTRHNVGFRIVDLLAEQCGSPDWKRLGQSLVIATQLDGRKVILAKPQTFMNLSGRAMRELLDFYPVELAQVLVVYDEIALPLGKIRIRAAGSSGGQKGMESIIRIIGSEEIPRLRIGVAQEEGPNDFSDFLLSDFEKSEEGVLEEVLERSTRVVGALLEEGFERVMSIYN
jgi:PTH1 family peptidyl-tRNA hydrolase